MGQFLWWWPIFLPLTVQPTCVSHACAHWREGPDVSRSSSLRTPARPADVWGPPVSYFFSPLTEHAQFRFLCGRWRNGSAKLKPFVARISLHDRVQALACSWLSTCRICRVYRVGPAREDSFAPSAITESATNSQRNRIGIGCRTLQFPLAQAIKMDPRTRARLSPKPSHPVASSHVANRWE
jgi:hypothetical protein